MSAAGRPNVLITGGTGFIGRHLVADLAASGWEVHVLARGTTDCAGLPGGVGVCLDDGSHVGLVRRLREVRPELVIHLAALFVSAHAGEDVPELIASNILFPTRLLEALRQTGCRRFINTGTAWQHFAGPGYEAVNLYAATKQAFADILDYYVKADDFAALTLELPDTYGPLDPRRKLFNLLREAATGGAVLEMSPGEQLLDLVHVADVVAAYRVAAERLLGESCGQAESWSVSSGELRTLRDIVTLFQQLNQGRPEVVWGGRPYRAREVMCPWAGELLPGWKPYIGLEEGLRSLLAAPPGGMPR